MHKFAIALLFFTAMAGCEEKLMTPDAGPLDPAYWPFEEVSYDMDQNYSLFVQWPAESPAPLVPFGFEWLTDHSGFYSGYFSGPRALGNLSLVEAEPGPRFGAEGYNATRVDLYVFIDTDEAVSYTESLPFQEIGRIPWIREDGIAPLTVADDVYYLGDNATAPQGTTHLPDSMKPYKSQMRQLANGLAVGGARSIIVPSEEAGIAGDLYGDLYITAQVTELVYAP